MKTILLLISMIIFAFPQKDSPTIILHLPIRLTVKSSFSTELIATYIITNELKKRKLNPVSRQDIASLYESFLKQKMESVISHEANKASSNEQTITNKMASIINDETDPFAQALDFRLIFDIDTLTQNFIWDSAFVKWYPLPSGINKMKTYPVFNINKESIHNKSIDSVIVMLIDSLTIPRKK